MLEFIIVLVGIIVAGVGGFFTYTKGKEKGRVEQQSEVRQHEQVQARKAKAIEESSRSLSDDDVISRMRERNR